MHQVGQIQNGEDILAGSMYFITNLGKLRVRLIHKVVMKSTLYISIKSNVS